MSVEVAQYEPFRSENLLGCRAMYGFQQLAFEFVVAQAVFLAAADVVEAVPEFVGNVFLA